MRRLPTIAACLFALALVAGCAPKGPKEIRVKVTENGFEPDKVSIKKGEEAVLVITREVEATCATEAIFTESGRKYDLPLHQAVRIELPTEAAGTLHYACPMDMFKGEVTIE